MDERLRAVNQWRMGARRMCSGSSLFCFTPLIPLRTTLEFCLHERFHKQLSLLLTGQRVMICRLVPRISLGIKARVIPTDPMQLRHYARRRPALIRSGHARRLMWAHLIAHPNPRPPPVRFPSIQILIVPPTRFTRVISRLSLRNDMARLYS